MALLSSACGPAPFRHREKPEPARHVTVGPKETADLSDREYLMRKATIGSRAERMEALDVIERANDPTFLSFLLERLLKEDDRFLQIRIMYALAATGDVRAIPALRSFARWDSSRVGIEAIAALYELGDDYFVPRLILKLRADEDNPEMAGIAFRALPCCSRAGASSIGLVV
ncbi:MAG: HEAT repeat domain-containing protein [Planctomycetota bacterium]|nr:HEAT repeat domain-containing protein [Planctomycetota bacterium]